MKFHSLLLCALVVCSALPAVAENSNIRPIPYKPDPPISIDGDLGDWQALPCSWSEEHSARIQTAWRQEALFIAVQSKSEIQRVLLTADIPGTDEQRTFLLDSTNTPSSSITLATSASDSLWVLEAAIPLSLLGVENPQEGVTFNLQLQLADDNLSETDTITAILSGADGKIGQTPPVADIFTDAVIEPGNHTKFSFDAPPCPEGLRAVLSLHARLDFNKVAGYSPALRVTLNDNAVGGDRMLNRPLRLKARGGALYSMAAGEFLKSGDTI